MKITITCRKSVALLSPAKAADLAHQSLKAWIRHDEAVLTWHFGPFTTRTRVTKAGWSIAIWRENT
jgi:hypothetical protein